MVDGEASPSMGPAIGSMLLLVRVLLVVAAAGAVVAAVVLVRRERIAAGDHTALACPMHPQITANAPGRCPLCGMALEPKRARPRPSSPDAETVMLPPQMSAARDVGTVVRIPVPREMRAPAFVEASDTVVALVYADELALLAPGETGIFHSAPPGDTAAVAVSQIDEPPRRWDASTSLARFRLGHDVSRTVGETGWVQFAPRNHEGLVIPRGAVLDGPAGPYVLTASPDGRTFTRRPIQLGRSMANAAVVVGGLHEGERFLQQTPIFVDTERRLGATAMGAAAPL
jgi:hypothetical protein